MAFSKHIEGTIKVGEHTLFTAITDGKHVHISNSRHNVVSDFTVRGVSYGGVSVHVYIEDGKVVFPAYKDLYLSRRLDDRNQKVSTSAQAAVLKQVFEAVTEWYADPKIKYEFLRAAVLRAQAETEEAGVKVLEAQQALNAAKQAKAAAEKTEKAAKAELEKASRYSNDSTPQAIATA